MDFTPSPPSPPLKGGETILEVSLKGGDVGEIPAKSDADLCEESLQPE